MRLLLRLASFTLALLALHVTGIIEIRWPDEFRAFADDMRDRTEEWVREGMPFPLRESQAADAPPSARGP